MVEKYLESLVESFVLYKVSRYDVKGKNYLTTGSKYYLSDIGLRYYLLGSKNADNEVDFVAVNEKGEEYYQVAFTVKDEKTLERELKLLDNINDHNPKYLLTTDYTPYTSQNGIKQRVVIR